MTVPEFIESIRKNIGPRQHYCQLHVDEVKKLISLLESSRGALDLITAHANEYNTDVVKIARAELERKVE